MLRYIELEPPKDFSFSQAKILTMEVSEGDTVKAGTPLMMLQLGGKKDKTKTPLPSTHTGRVTELMVGVGDTIHPRSTLALLETEVNDDTSNSEKKLDEKKLDTQKTVANSDQTENPAVEKNTQTSIAGLDSFSITETRQEANKKTSFNFEFTENELTQNKKSIADQTVTYANDTSSTTIRSSHAKNNESIKSNPSNSDQKNWNKTMSEIKVPDLGGASEVEVIDILVNVGDSVDADSPLLTVESDKASMDIPASSSGTIESILIKVGDTVSEGDVIIKIAGTDAVAATETAAPAKQQPSKEATPAADAGATTEVNITVPDLGGANDVDVIDILVAVGDSVEADQSIITVESDKASMDVPTAQSGTVTALKIAVGDKVNEGDIVLTISTSGASSANTSASPAPAKADTPAPATSPAPKAAAPAPQSASKQQGAPSTSGNSHASPSIRRFARELGVDLTKVTGSARKSRITKDDIKSFVKGVMSSGSATSGATSGGAGIPEVPAQDFSKFGEIEIQPLNKIKRVTASHLHRSWLNVPHVTHSDESNVASLEEFRKTLNAEYAKKKQNIKLSPLAFIVKAVISALKEYPQFNSSLENGGENLIVKNYYNIGIAVETPNGLVVPVIQDADKLSLADIATEMGNLAKKARDGKLTANDMSGGTFTISSLGGIGGTHFTPIVNAPEVAILGVSRTKTQPVWNGSEFEPAPILPISLSYDHRVIDGAEAARFTRHIAAVLEDLRRLAL